MIAIKQKKKIFSTITNLKTYGGAEKVLMDIHSSISCLYNAKIIGFQSYELLHPKHKIKKEEYIRFKNPFLLKNAIILVHARKLLPFLIVLNKIFFLRARIIYISHSIYLTHRKVTLFPKEVISISSKVTENLMHFFGVKEEQISLIHNGIRDVRGEGKMHEYKKDGIIKILYIARIDKWKQQVEIVKNLTNKILPNIVIHFAGIGDEFQILQKECLKSNTFKALGFIENVNALIQEYDYILLYSLKEGLPISLVEAAMNAKPVLSNDVGGSLEICIHNKNGFLIQDNWEDLINKINALDRISKVDYDKLSVSSREIYMEKFKYELMIEKYVELIEKGIEL